MKSLSRVRLFATPWTVTHQSPQSVEFSRLVYWSGLPFPSPGDLSNPGNEPGSPALTGGFFIAEPPEQLRISMLKVKVKSLSRVRLFATPCIVACTKLFCPRDFQGKCTGVGCHFLLQGIFPTQGSNRGLSHCRQTLYHLSYQGSHILKTIIFMYIKDVHKYNFKNMV